MFLCRTVGPRVVVYDDPLVSPPWTPRRPVYRLRCFAGCLLSTPRGRGAGLSPVGEVWGNEGAALSSSSATTAAAPIGSSHQLGVCAVTRVPVSVQQRRLPGSQTACKEAFLDELQGPRREDAISRLFGYSFIGLRLGAVELAGQFLPRLTCGQLACR